jgi:hypothetical protein
VRSVHVDRGSSTSSASRGGCAQVVTAVLSIPYSRTQITTHLTPGEFGDRLRTITNNSWWGVRSQANARFVGRITYEGFRLSYVSGGRNTYAPWIRGSIHPHRDGSVIDVRMSIHPIGAGAVLAFALVPMWFARGTPSHALTWLLAMLIFHVVMYYIGFRTEALDAEVLLREVAALSPQTAIQSS